MLLRFFTIISLLSAAFVITSIGLQTPLGLAIKHAVGSVPYGDKTLHFLLLTGLSFLLNASLKGKQAKIGGMSLLIGSLVLASGITIEEISQAFIPSRNFEILDMLCNYAGIYTGSLLLFFFPTLTTDFDHDDHGNTFPFQKIFR